jgi:AcrR family transcriptional regulator
VNETEQKTSAEQILHVAIKLFSQKGYEATSTREIAEAAGVTKPMLYYYFGNKDGICKAATKHFADHFFARLEAFMRKDRQPREAIVGFICTHFEFMESHQHEDVARFFVGLCCGPERDRFAEDIRTLDQQGHALFRDFAARIARAGVLRPGCEDDFAMSLHGMIAAWHMAHIVEGVELSRAIAERIVDNLLEGFASR